MTRLESMGAPKTKGSKMEDESKAGCITWGKREEHSREISHQGKGKRNTQ